MAAEEFKARDLLFHIIVPLRTIYIIYIYRADGVELQDVVVEVEKCFANLGPAYLCGVREDAHLGRRAIDVPDLTHPIDYFREIGVQGWLAVSGEGQYVGHYAFCLQFLEFAFKAIDHLVGRWQRILSPTFTVQAALAIDAVETAHFSTLRQQIDAERDAQPTAVDGSENRGIIDDCAHNLCKGTQ